jgi:hypothetical protein
MPDSTQASDGVITKPSSKSVPQTIDGLRRERSGISELQLTGFLAGRHHLEGELRAPFDAVESIVEALPGV